MLIYRRRFRHDNVPIQILASVRVPHDDDAPVPAEEHGIRDHDDGTRHRGRRRNGICIQLCPYPFLAPMIFPGKLINGAVVVGVETPKGSARDIWPSCAPKSDAACRAFVALDAVVPTILYGSRMVAGRADSSVFLYRILNV